MKFDGEDPVDRELYEKIYQAEKVHAVLQDLINWIRQEIKHGDLSEAEQNAFEAVREMLNEQITEYGVGSLFY